MRPETTLFMLQSIDGKISFGESNHVDFDLQIPKLKYASIGLQQYYNKEKETDTWTLCSGKTLAKIGWNEKVIRHVPYVNMVVVDTSHMTMDGLINLCYGYEKVVLVTDNEGLYLRNTIPGLDIIVRKISNDFEGVFEELYLTYGCRRITIQAGGTLNAVLLRKGFIDKLNIIIAPMLVGGCHTPTIVDGTTLGSEGSVLLNVKEFKLESVSVLQDSYIQLLYSRVEI